MSVGLTAFFPAVCRHFYISFHKAGEFVAAVAEIQQTASSDSVLLVIRV